MMKLLNTEQIRQADAYTIQHGIRTCLRLDEAVWRMSLRREAVIEQQGGRFTVLGQVHSVLTDSHHQAST